jgi:hypothetical protein
LVQLALPKAKGGLEPLTLHPLLYLTLGLGLGRRAAGTERTDWLRWLLAANGLLAQPANELLNRVVLDLVVERGELRREAVQQAIFALPPLGRGPSEEQDRIAWLTKLGLELAEPHLPEIGPPEDVARVLDRFPTPDEVEGLMLKRMLLRGWAGSRNNNFILLWNQRVPLEAFFGGVSYIPVLFSKGSPLDGDHVAARSLFKHSGAHGVDRASMAGAVDSLLADPAIARLVDAAELPRLRARATVTPQAFRLAFSDCLANRSFLPKWLNRSVQDLRVVEKLSLPRIQAALKGTPLAPTLSGLLARPDGQGGDPHDWSAIPPGDRVAWDTVPPERAARWDAPTIATFMRAILGRERFLYANAHDLVMLGPGSSASGHHGSDPSDAGGGPPA